MNRDAFAVRCFTCCYITCFSSHDNHMIITCSLQQIIGRVDVIVRSGSELEQNPHTDQETVQGLMSKIQTFMNDFDEKLAKRKKTLHDSVRLHKLIEAVSGIVQTRYNIECNCTIVLFVC